MNTLTSVITFLMVFLIQTSQNRDSTALQAKLDELIRASNAQNVFVGLEQLSSEEITEVRQEVSWTSRKTQEGQGRIAHPANSYRTLFFSRLDIKAGAAKLKADKAGRLSTRNASARLPQQA
jgi:low affinity Fe/Cu permease